MNKKYLWIAVPFLVLGVMRGAALALNKKAYPVQPNSATNTATYLDNQYRVYSFPSLHSQQAVCLEVYGGNVEGWISLYVRSGALISLPGRCP